MPTFGTEIWDLILSILVMFHVVVEFIHYGHEYMSAKKEKQYLKDIHAYRKKSTKTAKLIKLQSDMDLIKKHLKIEEET